MQCARKGKMFNLEKGESTDLHNLKTSTGRKYNTALNSKSVKNLFFDNRIDCDWLNTKEASQYLSITENALRIMVHRGQIEVYKFGRRLRFRLQDCQALFLKKGA